MSYLGIEIGGTKLQLGIGTGNGGPLTHVERTTIDPARGAAGILEQVEQLGSRLIQQHDVRRIGIGFGGPVRRESGRTIKSHQINGWEDFPLANWCQETFRVSAVIGNDCDVAALAEAISGAGRGHRTVFYVTVGTGVGGGLVIDGRLHGGDRPAVAEIGHLRPGLHADRPESTVESVASGWGIVAEAQARLRGDISRPLVWSSDTPAHQNPAQIRKRLSAAKEAETEFQNDLLIRCEGDLDRLTGQMIAAAAIEGNRLAAEVLRHATQVLGWAVAQCITLIAPEVIVIGGGVAQIGEQWFLQPVREAAARYVFPPLAGAYHIMPAALGELVVVHGALALAEHAARS